MSNLTNQCISCAKPLPESDSLDGIHFITGMKRTDAETLDILFNAWHCQLMVSSFPSLSTCTFSRARRTALGIQPTNTHGVPTLDNDVLGGCSCYFTLVQPWNVTLRCCPFKVDFLSFMIFSPRIFIRRSHLQAPAFAKVDFRSMIG